jgi:hypothetical protein
VPRWPDKSAERLSVAGWLSFCKLVLHPAFVAFAALCCFRSIRSTAAVMIAAASLPVAGNVYILAQHYGVAPQRVSASILFPRDLDPDGFGGDRRGSPAGGHRGGWLTGCGRALALLIFRTRGERHGNRFGKPLFRRDAGRLYAMPRRLTPTDMTFGLFLPEPRRRMGRCRCCGISRA